MLWYVLALPISVFLAGTDWERKSKEEGRGRRVKERGSGGNGKERKEKGRRGRRRKGVEERWRRWRKRKENMKAQSEAYLLPSKNVLVEVEL